ncbi:MAG: ribonuclease E activity regulator RraA [Pseudomonadota bacterium]
MADIATPDIADAYPDDVDVLAPILRNFGGRENFFGAVVTIKCHEDNSLVKEQAATAGDGRVMVVDGGGSLRRALLGDQVAATAAANGWSGLIIWGAVRDIDALAHTGIGVQALAPIPVKTEKRGLGDLDVPVTFGGVTFASGDWVYADNNGVLRAGQELDLSKAI